MRLVIDISAILYKSAYKLNELTNNGVKTGIIFGALKSLSNLAEIYEPDEMIIAWDSGHDKRSAIYPLYKENRKKDKEFLADLDRQKILLRSILDSLPVTHVSLCGVEADDCIAVITKFLALEKVGIVTGDKDLYQLANCPNHLIITTKGNVVELEMESHQYLAYKVLVGDPSDNIKGIDGIGDVRAKRLLKEYGSLASILFAAKELGVLGSMKYLEAEEIIRRNMELMTVGCLLSKVEKDNILEQYKAGRLSREIDEVNVRKSMMDLGFVSLVSRLSGFLAPFRKMVRTKCGGKIKIKRNVVVIDGNEQKSNPVILAAQLVKENNKKALCKLNDDHLIRTRFKYAVEIIKLFKKSDVKEWLSNKPKFIVQRIQDIVQRKKMTVNDIEFVEKIYDEYLSDPPEWMLVPCRSKN